MHGLGRDSKPMANCGIYLPLHSLSWYMISQDVHLFLHLKLSMGLPSSSYLLQTVKRHGSYVHNLKLQHELTPPRTHGLKSKRKWFNCQSHRYHLLLPDLKAYITLHLAKMSMFISCSLSRDMSPISQMLAGGNWLCNGKICWMFATPPH